jgi:hypothetical protein
MKPTSVGPAISGRTRAEYLGLFVAQMAEEPNPTFKGEIENQPFSTPMIV